MSYVPEVPGLTPGASPRSDPWVEHFLRRLRRLLVMYGERNGRARPEEVELLGRAIYSTYRDLEALGAEREAKALLKDVSAASEDELS